MLVFQTYQNTLKKNRPAINNQNQIIQLEQRCFNQQKNNKQGVETIHSGVGYLIFDKWRIRKLHWFFSTKYHPRRSRKIRAHEEGSEHLWESMQECSSIYLRSCWYKESHCMLVVRWLPQEIARWYEAERRHQCALAWWPFCSQVIILEICW